MIPLCHSELSEESFVRGFKIFRRVAPQNDKEEMLLRTIGWKAREKGLSH